MRWCIYLHLSGVVLCEILTLALSGLFISQSVSAFVETRLALLFLPALLSLFVCPVLAVVIAVRRSLSSMRIRIGLLAETVLVFGQLLVLTPLVTCS